MLPEYKKKLCRPDTHMTSLSFQTENFFNILSLIIMAFLAENIPIPINTPMID